ncbi:glycosyltransferase [Anaerocolumna sp. AGMB13020]|uniref:tetratricopeptide repeat-containing glycosyltransferase family 2 protein n=1 Tax=Anaerocolumna sp. AGMB13020 TaxID=3081750 RepID=UPI0029548A45|nr:glycosyltransferase [Anaerocolumna sp. AGMB13020]WOO36087.1 glycosyltransferase [Anaerocolumna sp. AGMB13020]
MGKKKTVSLCMIVKDEEWILEQCLGSVSGIVDEIIIGDTGSEDNSKEIAARYGATVFDIEWEDDFAAARNQTLERATCDWILLLDADELFREEDTENFYALLDREDYDGYHFTLHNYYSTENTKDYSVHYAFRMVRNTGEYYFEGRIHEQINNRNGNFDSSRFTLAEITLHHFGYTDKVIQQKEKHNRNMPLLKKQLEDNPEDPYYLFNLGNEYMAQGDCNNALPCYLKAHEKKAHSQAYFPHVYYRIILCYMTQGDSTAALFFAEEGLMEYPSCTDIEYLKGSIYKSNHRNLLAVRSFERCLAMGEAPNTLKFTAGCGTYRALIALGEIYYEEEIYQDALDYYAEALSYPEAPDILLPLAKCLYPQCKERQEFFDKLLAYITAGSLEEKYLKAADILVELRLYELSHYALSLGNFTPNNSRELLMVSGKLSFFLHLYDNAIDTFSALYAMAASSLASAADTEEIIAYYLLSLILTTDEVIDRIHSLLDNMPEQLKSTSLFVLEQLIPSEFHVENSSSYQYNFLYKLLEKLMKAGETTHVDALAAALPKLNILDAYTKLGEIYLKQDYREKAIHAILLSVRQYNFIDKNSANLLLRYL